MLEKNIFKKYKFNSKYNIIGDFDFFIKISQKYKIGCIQSPLASYRVHDSNLSGKRIDLHIKELKDWLSINKKKLEKDFNPISDMRASGSYRMEVAKNLLEKFYAEIKGKKLIGVYF